MGPFKKELPLFYYKTDKCRVNLGGYFIIYCVFYSLHFVASFYPLIVRCFESLLGSLVGWSVGDGGVFHFHFPGYLFGFGFKFDVCSL